METTEYTTPVKRFWRLLKPDRKEIKNVYAYAIFNGLVYLSLPLGIQAIINLIQGGQVSTSWIVLVIFVVLGVAITGVLQILQLRITENLQQKIFTRAAFEFAYRIPRVRMEAIYRHHAPELMNRFFDIVSVQKGLSKILIDFSTAILNIFFGLILLSFYDAFFILFSLIIVALVYTIFRFTVKRGLETSLKESKFKYKVAHWLEELARTAATFKLAGKTELPLNTMNDNVDDYLQARESHFGILVRQYSLMVLFKVLVAAGLLAIGGILVMEQQMNIGQFVAAEIIILMVMSSVEKLFTSLETIYDVLTALEKVGQVTDLELEPDGGLQLHTVSTGGGIEIELKDVDFSFPGGDKNILDKISLHVKSGEKLVVMGPNGSGKSTLLQIIAGLYSTKHGSIVYDKNSKENLELCSLRSSIGDFLNQEDLFEGTVMENISMGREAAHIERVKWAIENLGLGSFINSLPKGLETVLDAEGKKLPRSIVQKILLARSIADKPRLLLLEHAFEHIDLKERERIIDFLISADNPWTVVAVSGDPYLARKSDRVALMEDGKIIRSGKYPEVTKEPKKNNDA